MSNMKYIIDDDGIGFVFPSLIDHSEFAKNNTGRKVIGAGFCQISNDIFHCYGKSISLGVDSRGQVDSDKLNRIFKLGNFQY